MKGRFTPRHLTSTLAAFDRQIAGMNTVLECYAAMLSPSFPELLGDTWQAVTDAWNAAHDAHTTLCRARADIALNQHQHRCVGADPN